MTMHPSIDGELLLSDIDELGRIGADPAGGISRLAFNAGDMQGRAWVAGRAAALGLDVTIDPIGNTIAMYAGSEPGRKPLVIGSHTDTVAQGGPYDGALGVLAGLACARALCESGTRLRHPLAVINFVAEEATMLGTLGSAAMAGELAPADMDKPAYDGRTVAEHLQAAGFDPARMAGAIRTPGCFAAYLELHVEQGQTLEAERLTIGVVEGIVGIRRFAVTFAGQANHAGTTPMARRHDALVAAATFVLAVRDTATAHAIVGTVGTLQVQPNVANVVPGRVELTFEIRGLDDRVLDAAEQALLEQLAGLGGDVRPLSHKQPVPCDRHIQAVLAACCERLGMQYRRMPSGAGHDAMYMAALAPTGMLFVPSRAGISHAPEEYTAPQECVAGAQLLLAALLELDQFD